LPIAFHHPVRVGGVELPGNLFLAPVAGYSDAAFRSVCVDEGADLCYTEMVSAEGLVREHPKTRELLARAENETRYAIQLFGSKPESLARAAEEALAFGPVLVDLNCGCPVPKIVKSGAGSALLRDPALLEAIVAAMAAVLGPAGVPVTVKIRSGWDSESLNYRETAARAVGAGAAAVTLHARTRAQGYSGSADWAQVAELAGALGVPVFGSGDVSGALAPARMLAETGCAGVMVARGAMGDPFFFREARAAMEGRAPEPPTPPERAAAARRHLGLSARFLGERSACIEFRKHFCSYTKGTAGGAALRAEAVRSSTIAEFEALLDRWVAH
jgi:tRNA-dihydrouridine synthase B